MTLPTPRLDDRTFQELVDEAKRNVQRRCPEWTNHNVSDPGVTLIETFAWMTDMLLYRLNRVPDRLYVKFLELRRRAAVPAARGPDGGVVPAVVAPRRRRPDPRRHRGVDAALHLRRSRSGSPRCTSSTSRRRRRAPC